MTSLYWIRALYIFSPGMGPCSLLIQSSVAWSSRVSPYWYGGLVSTSSLQWRHNGHDSVSNHQPHHCLLKRLFRRRSKQTSKLRVTGLCVGNSPGAVNSPHKWPVTRKMFPFDDVILYIFSPGMDPCSLLIPSSVASSSRVSPYWYGGLVSTSWISTYIHTIISARTLPALRSVWRVPRWCFLYKSP